jgi:hypothetical protein
MTLDSLNELCTLELNPQIPSSKNSAFGASIQVSKKRNKRMSAKAKKKKQRKVKKKRRRKRKRTK